jgi:PIN domain nuclease of toxin-antitoxin system
MPIADVVLLDTHIWLDVALGRDRGMTPRVRRKLDTAASAGSLYVAAVTPWEVAMLARGGKVRVNGPLREFIAEALRETRTAVAPLEPAIAVDAVELPAWDHRDPADRMIVATARYIGALLVTRDTAILEYAARAKAVRTLEPK